MDTNITPEAPPTEEVVPSLLTDDARARLDEIDTIEPVVETEATETAEVTETETEVEEVADWRDDDVKALAASMGIDEAKLSRMPSRDVFEAAALMYDTDLAAQGRALMQPVETEQGQAEPPKTAPAATAPAPVTAAAPQALQPILDTLAKWEADPEIDPELRDVLKGMAGYIQPMASRLEAMNQQQAKLMEFAQYQANQLQQQRIAQEEQFFNDQLSAIDPEFFGKDWDSATPEQRAAREKVAPEVGALRTAEANRRGQYVALDKPLVMRAYRVALGDKLVERAVQKTKDEKNKQIATQSAKRLGGATRNHKPPVPPPVSGDLTEDPVLLTRAREIMSRPAHEDRSVVGR